jgi:hypothetical protein
MSEACNTREATNRLLEMVEEGLIDRDMVIMCCVKYMSEDEVADMCQINDFFYDEDEHDPDCTDCEHDCPWRNNPMGAPFCSICDDHMEANAVND